MTELELRAHKLSARGAIENLMSRNAYRHAAGDSVSPQEFPSDTPLASDQIVEMAMRCLVSPVIEISDDGMSAKGQWYSPGFCLRYDKVAATSDLTWLWEEYSGEFSYVNGTWQLIHQTCRRDIAIKEPDTWTP